MLEEKRNLRKKETQQHCKHHTGHDMDFHGLNQNHGREQIKYRTGYHWGCTDCSQYIGIERSLF